MIKHFIRRIGHLQRVVRRQHNVIVTLQAENRDLALKHRTLMGDERLWVGHNIARPWRLFCTPDHFRWWSGPKPGDPEW